MLQDQLAASRAAPADMAGGTLAPQSPVRGPEPEGENMLKGLFQRLEEMESLVRLDAGRTPRAEATAEALTARVEAGVPAPSGGVEDTIARLERETTPPHQAFLRQLRRFREIPPLSSPCRQGTRRGSLLLTLLASTGVAMR